MAPTKHWTVGSELILPPIPTNSHRPNTWANGSNHILEAILWSRYHPTIGTSGTDLADGIIGSDLGPALTTKISHWRITRTSATNVAEGTTDPNYVDRTAATNLRDRNNSKNMNLPYTGTWKHKNKTAQMMPVLTKTLINRNTKKSNLWSL